MADISYNPTFHHVAWEDRRDRVEAAGPNGFNVRFNAIASDLRQLSTVVTRVGAAIDVTNVPPPPQQQQLSFTPVLRSAPNSVLDWSYDANGAATGTLIPLHPGVEIHGLANLNLPDGLWLTAMRVVGSNDRINNAPLFGDIALARTPLRLVAPPPDLETLATVTAINGGVEGDFDIPVPVTTSLIDTDVFRYVLTADVRGVQGTVTIQAVRLTFSPQP